MTLAYRRSSSSRPFVGVTMPRILLIAAAVVAAACSSKPSAQNQAKPAEAAVKLSLATVTTAPAPERLVLTGLIAAEESSDVASSVPGRVVATPAEFAAAIAAEIARMELR